MSNTERNVRSENIRQEQSFKVNDTDFSSSRNEELKVLLKNGTFVTVRRNDMKGTYRILNYRFMDTINLIGILRFYLLK